MQRAVSCLFFVSLLSAAPTFASPNDASPEVSLPAFHCDGTDPALFQEMREAGYVGYGETWDHDTCGQGATVYAAGATQWADMRPKWSLAARPKIDAEFYATVFPTVAFGGMGALFAIAWLIAFLQRRRRVRVAHLACPACSVKMTVTLEDPSLRNQFCPACGTSCVVVGEGHRPADAVAVGS
ncbi:MAG: hypothetical protein ACO3JL_16015 [Myxococcota bacterium]